MFVAKLLVLNFKFPVKIKHFLCYLQVISCIFLSIRNTVSVVEMTFANIQTRIIEKLQNFPKFENYLLNRFLHWEYYLQEVNLSGFSFWVYLKSGQDFCYLPIYNCKTMSYCFLWGYRYSVVVLFMSVVDTYCNDEPQFCLRTSSEFCTIY